MKILITKLLMVAGMSVALPLTVHAKLNVVATTPDLAALAREVGGDRVNVTVLAKATEDPHFVDAKPSLIVTLNHADAVIEGGAELEIGWLPPLLSSARNSKLAVGSPGRMIANVGIEMLEIPTTKDRSEGDVHPLGNPHFLIDPVNARIAAANIADGFMKLDPSYATTYKANLEKFQAALDTKLAEWQKRLAPFKGAKIVTYHKDTTYFAERFGFEVVATLEPKPGVPPSPSHLAEVITKMKAAHAKIILFQPFQNRKTAETVGSHTQAKVLDFPQQPGALKNTDSYLQLLDYLVQTIATALEEKK